MPPNRRAVSLGTDSLRQHPGVHRSARSAKIAKPAARSANRLSLSTLLQIVPKFPGGIDGVGDYALTIAKDSGTNSRATLCSPLSRLLQPKMLPALKFYHSIVCSTTYPENTITR